MDHSGHFIWDPAAHGCSSHRCVYHAQELQRAPVTHVKCVVKSTLDEAKWRPAVLLNVLNCASALTKN